MAFTPIPSNLKDYFDTINQRIRKLESAPDQAMTTATSAQTSASAASATATAAATAAGIAQAQAITAQAQATVAYNSAIQSLQPSASTIVNASNQITAISTNGITVYSGSSSSSGARVVMNSAGIAGYNSTGSATFSIDSSTGNATFSGNVTGSTITGGSLNIAGNTTINYLGNGILIASGATITGTINATAGYFGTSSNGWSIGSTGITGVGTATITGGQINGSSLNIGSGTFQVNSSGSMTATSGTIGGFTLSSTALTSPGGALYINSSSATVYGTTVNAGSGGMTSANTITATGYMYANSYFYNGGYATTTSSANAYINSSTGLLARSSSSLRYKLDVEPQTIPLQSILSLTPKSFIDKASADAQGGSTTGLPRILGLIAEEVAEIPVLADLLMNKNEQGQPDSVNYDRIAIALIPLLQDHETRLAKLEGANGTTTSA